jgi:D-sedoheptulose 7-phosphate isomerase
MNELLARYPALEVCKEDILKAKEAIIKCYENGGKLLLCGNGGSCADCDHIVGELMKGFLKKRPLNDEKKTKMLENCPELDSQTLASLQDALPAISLTSYNALNTAFANDVDPELTFAQGVLGLGKSDDVLIAISTSGNSKSVTTAAKVAQALGVKVIALTGRDGGTLRAFSDVAIIAPEYETYRIQELHLPIYHYLCAEVEKHFFI